MKHRVFIISLFLGITFSPMTPAGMYKWVDENGKIHYSQRPPPQQEAQEIKSTSQRSNLRAKIKDDAVYCGDEKLPFKLDDELMLLANLRPNLDNYRERVSRARGEYRDAVGRKAASQLRSSSSANQSEYIERSRKKLYIAQCQLAWAEKKIMELEPLRQEFLKEVGHLEKDFEASKNECGDKPPGGWKSDEDYNAWARCITSKKKMRERNKKLSTLKRYRSLRRMLED